MRELCVQRDSVGGLMVELNKRFANAKPFRSPIGVEVETSTMLILVTAQRLEY